MFDIILTQCVLRNAVALQIDVKIHVPGISRSQSMWDKVRSACRSMGKFQTFLRDSTNIINPLASLVDLYELQCMDHRRSSRTTPCVTCGKVLSFPSQKFLLEPMSKGKLVFPQQVLSSLEETWPNFLLQSYGRVVHFQMNFPCEFPCKCCKTLYVVQFPVTYVCSLFLEVRLGNFPVQGNHPTAPCAQSS